ncbi:hypothetical protein FRX31_006514 [Thalictrum thalictroides]|uniref:Uncharacterized protein n=1 Tax=Thalictrum thalictroides TaxID=46969 RepID=A0A7J6X4X4_THATH|nr:hypothetical protein FRX31_006514 [Thalictrum thalictroides]
MICWQCIKGPRQPNGSLTCGFYATRFMKDMMEDSEQTVAAKMKKLAEKKNYTRKEIDEVRFEIIEFFQQCMV